MIYLCSANQEKETLRELRWSFWYNKDMRRRSPGFAPFESRKRRGQRSNKENTVEKSYS